MTGNTRLEYVRQGNFLIIARWLLRHCHRSSGEINVLTQGLWKSLSKVVGKFSYKASAKWNAILTK